MLLTTSRKPSRKTRTLAKMLAGFMGWKYLPRGKMSIEEVFSLLNEDDQLVLLEEIKKNPAFLKVIHPSKGELLSLRFNVGEIEKVKVDDSHVVFIGKPRFDPIIIGALPFSKKVDSKKKIFVKGKEGWTILDFNYEGKSILKLKVKNEG
jgi:U3 small nucleolar ribonucleoprotein protein IMP4